MNRVVHTDRIETVAGSRIVFDTNVWVMIEGFNQAAPAAKVAAYSAAYDALLRGGSEVLYNDYVINEFCNTCARIAYNAARARAGGAQGPSFKEFRSSDAYEPVAAAIREACLNIFEACTYVPVEARHVDVRRIVEALGPGRLDFTDLVLVGFCRAEGAILLTDDADFAREDITIISANRRLQVLAASRATAFRAGCP